jgi:oligoendopeptidase F
MTSAPIPLRSEIAETDIWDLQALFSSEEAYRRSLEQYRSEFPNIIRFKGKIGQSAQNLRDCLEFEKSLDLLGERLGHYTSLRAAEDSSNDENLARRAELTNLFTRAREASAFVTPDIQQIPDETFQGFVNDPLLQEWQISLTRLRRYRPHTLSEPEERLLAAGGSVIHAHSETFSQLTNVDMKFGTVRAADNQEVPLSQSTFVSFLQQPEREVRERAFHQFYQEFGDHQYTLASSLSASIRGDAFYARSRNYGSSLDAALFPDNVPPHVYDNLIATVRSHLEALHDYYDLRKEVLGLADLHQYDTFVPLVPAIRKNVSFDEAVHLVTESLEPLGSEYVETLRSGLNSRWVDRYETKGKRSGAFSSSSYGNPPYILMNYKADVFSHIFTLAHEAGHSMHSWFSQQHQPFQTYGYPIFLAEVASTFNEALLTHSLLEQAQDPGLRAYLIDRQIEDIRSVLFRQTMFAEFEKQTHAIEEKGEPLTLATFKQLYWGLLEAYFGPRFTLDPELELECLRIPHFYSAFYVYKYATGVSAAIALADRVMTGDPGARTAYLEFLRSGGSEFPIETLEKAGVDMRTPAPIEEAIQLFSRRVGELRTLLRA